MSQPKRFNVSATRITKEDAEEIRRLYQKGEMKIQPISRIFCISTQRCKKIAEGSDEEIGGWQEKRTYNSISDKIPSSQATSEPPPAPSQTIDSRLLDDLTKEAEDSLDQLNQRRWHRVRSH